jgi:DNA (cytosine-5)-methyltransferase 1
MCDIKAISLFSGMGGDSLGMETAGIRVIAYSENDRMAIKSHHANFPESVLLGSPSNRYNLTRIPDSDFTRYRGIVNLIFAGFPCQGFSQGGKKLPSDPRNTLFREFARVTQLVEPKYIIGENVPGLLTRQTESGEKFIDVIVQEFEQIGYRIQYKTMLASEYGVAQDRKRLIMVGVRNDIPADYEFPNPSETRLNLRNIVSFNMDGSLEITDEDYPLSSLPDDCVITNLDNTESESSTPVHPYLRLKAKTRNESYRGTTYPNLLSFGKRGSPIHAEIIDIREPCKTIICTYDHQPRLFVPQKNQHGGFLRCLLPDELKQIQGFPADYVVCGNRKDQIKQIGNAVPPPLISKVVENLILLDASLE